MTGFFLLDGGIAYPSPGSIASPLAISGNAIEVSRGFHLVEDGTLHTINLAGLLSAAFGASYSPMLWLEAYGGNLDLIHGSGNMFLPAGVDQQLGSTEVMAFVYDPSASKYKPITAVLSSRARVPFSFRLAQMTTSSRASVEQSGGSLIYNTETQTNQAYDGDGWGSLWNTHDATVSTADATVTTLDSIALVEARQLIVETYIEGHRDDFSAACGGTLRLNARRATGGNITLIGSVTADIQSDTTATATMDVDTGTQTARIRVTGVAAQDWDWYSRTRYRIVA